MKKTTFLIALLSVLFMGACSNTPNLGKSTERHALYSKTFDVVLNKDSQSVYLESLEKMKSLEKSKFYITDMHIDTVGLNRYNVSMYYFKLN